MTDAEKQRRLQAALDRGDQGCTMADVVERLRDGRAQWWSRGDGMVVTEVFERNGVAVCHYWLGAGSLQDCIALIPEINQWAVERGCAASACAGRRGWQRVLAAHGWRPYDDADSPAAFKPLTPAGERFGQHV